MRVIREAKAKGMGGGVTQYGIFYESVGIRGDEARLIRKESVGKGWGMPTSAADVLTCNMDLIA